MTRETEKGKGARKTQDRYDSHVNVFKVCDNGCDVAAPTRVRENHNLSLGPELYYWEEDVECECG